MVTDPASPFTPPSAGAGSSTEPARPLKRRHITMITIGGIIGAGLFVGSSASIAAIGPAVIVSYILAGMIVLMIMRMLSEMAVANPAIQTFPEFIRVGLGDWAGFVSGWLYWYFWVVLVAIETLAGAVILSGWIALPVWAIGAFVLAAMTGINCLSARSYGESEFWLSSLKVAAIITFIALAAAHVLGLAGTPAVGLRNMVSHGSVIAGVTTVIFALVGAEIATIAAAESEEPARTVARLTGSVAVRILIFYVFSIGLIVAIVPWDQIQPGHSPFTAALSRMAIPAAVEIMNGVVLIAVLSCLNSGIYVTSRVLLVLAAQGNAPQGVRRTNASNVPIRSILIGSACGSVALAASVLSPALVFSFLVNASGALMLIIYAMIGAAQIRLRRHYEAHAPERLGVRMWLFPWMSYATLAAIALVLTAMAMTPDLSAQLIPSIAVTLLCLAIYSVRRPKGRMHIETEAS
jgi:GABA permease